MTAFWGTTVSQSSNGVQFEDLTWEEAIESAQKEDKLIFLDAYTTWCQPCKQMDKQVFTAYRLGNLYNQHFVNVKLDMEKGLGPMLAIRYNINIFPTFLYLTSDGTVVHRHSGYQNIGTMVGLAKTALDPKKKMDAWDQRYREGDRHPDFMYNYLMAKYEIGDGSHVAFIDEYFKSQKDWNSDVNVKLIYEFTEDVDDPKFDYLLENRNRFFDVIGQDEVTESIEIMLSNKLYNTTPLPKIEEVGRLYTKIYGDQGDYLFSAYRMQRYLNGEDYTKFAESAVYHVEQFKISDNTKLNYLAWQFYEHVGDKDLLEKAIDWSKRSIKYDANYYNYDTLAALYYKIRKKRKAKKAAKKALKIAKKKNIDAVTTVQLLEKIKKL